MKNLQAVFTTVTIVCIMGCATPTKLGVKTACPGQSVATISAYLYKDALSSFKRYYLGKQLDPEFTVIDTRHIALDGELILDGRGRLHSGKKTEEWTLKHDGNVEIFTVVIMPDGKGGNYFMLKGPEVK